MCYTVLCWFKVLKTVRQFNKPISLLVDAVCVCCSETFTQTSTSNVDYETSRFHKVYFFYCLIFLIEGRTNSISCRPGPIGKRGIMVLY